LLNRLNSILLILTVGEDEKAPGGTGKKDKTASARFARFFAAQQKRECKIFRNTW
jgi:hypothetical protein